MTNATATGERKLDPADIERYRDRGYVVVERLLDDDILDRSRSALAGLVERSRGVVESDTIFDLEPTHRPDAPRLRRIKQPHRHEAAFAELIRLPAIVRILQQLLGPAVRFQGTSKLNLKEPYVGAPVEWHQDWAFYPHTNDDLLAVGIMLEDSTPENGPLLVIPGTHRGQIFNHHAGGYFCGAIDPAEMNGAYDQAVALTGPAGSVTFHHVRLVHGSAQNRSPNPRPLLLNQYVAGDAWPLTGVHDMDKYDALLVTGEPTLTPRLEKVPVRLPHPQPPLQGSIYEKQASAINRFFNVDEPSR